ncbi:hypothetical protein WN943_010771 [Citrus x changshan-huyou]
MGCCISSNKKIPHQPKPPVVEEPGSSNRSPPPPCLEEEEAVKEVVLSETSLPKPQQNPKENINTTQMATIQELNIEAEEEEGEGDMSRVLSQVSENYSIGESFSTATTATTTTTVTLTEIKDDNEAISKATSRDLSHSSPAKVPRKRPNAGGAKSPSKRADSLRDMSRPVPGRTVPRNVGPTGVRRGSSSSSRRLRSPAAGGVGNATTGRAGGKLRVEKESQIKNEVNDGVLVEKSELSESLNNPHVSLECFIFL